MLLLDFQSPAVPLCLEVTKLHTFSMMHLSAVAACAFPVYAEVHNQYKLPLCST
jgi:hypothetical protein